MPKTSEAIRRFLESKRDSHSGVDLLDRILVHIDGLELQVNVAAGNGEPVDGKRGTYSDGVNSWFNLRIPHKANTDTPEWQDYSMAYPLELHADGIGSTGWDWKAKRSRYVAFDFDSIVGHAQGIGITDEDLARVRRAAQAVPYVETRLSTGGKGLHLYVWFNGDGIPTNNHTEHAALARCVLGMLSSEATFDFASHIDACGHIMWFWHRKMTAENKGLSLIKAAERKLTAADLPLNWRDHIEVVSRKRTKVRVNGVDDKTETAFDTLNSARQTIPLDAQHRKLIEALGNSGFSAIWVSDHHLLQTHTKALENLINTPETRTELRLVGQFRTLSEGNDPGTPNCFLFPLENGAWKVFRFSRGINEAETWTQDPKGWTTCYFNRIPDFDTACKMFGGISDGGSYVFTSLRKAAEVGEALGQPLRLNAALLDRETRLTLTPQGKLKVSVKRLKDDPASLPGYIDKKDNWVREFDKEIERGGDRTDEVDWDSHVRSLLTPVGASYGWVAKNQTGDWTQQPVGNVKMLLQGLDLAKDEAERIMGVAVRKAWKMANIPFAPEYPGGRIWNYDAAQWR